MALLILYIGVIALVHGLHLYAQNHDAVRAVEGGIEYAAVVYTCTILLLILFFVVAQQLGWFA